MLTVPNMINKDQEVARNELTTAGFTPIFRETYDDNIAKGMVVKTEPAAGTAHPEGKEVLYFVSQGPLETQVKVPNVVGMTREKAIAALKANKLGYEATEIKKDGDKDKVVEQSINEGEYVDKGQVVTIFISTGTADPTALTMRIPMPNGIRGSYTIDVYRDGSVAYTKTIQNAETVAGSTVSIDIEGKKTERLSVYIKSNDFGQENYIQYAKYDINYDTEEVKLVDGKLNETDLLKITPAATYDPTQTTSSEPQTVVPDTTTSEDPGVTSVPDNTTSTDDPFSGIGVTFENPFS